MTEIPADVLRAVLSGTDRTVPPPRAPQDDVVSQNARRLQWFTTAELQAEIERRAVEAGR